MPPFMTFSFTSMSIRRKGIQARGTKVGAGMTRSSSSAFSGRKVNGELLTGGQQMLTPSAKGVFRAVVCAVVVSLAIVPLARPALADDPTLDSVRHAADGEGSALELTATQRQVSVSEGDLPSSSVGGGSGGGSAGGSADNAPAVPAASEAPGGGSVPGGRAAGGRW